MRPHAELPAGLLLVACLACPASLVAAAGSHATPLAGPSPVDSTARPPAQTLAGVVDDRDPDPDETSYASSETPVADAAMRGDRDAVRSLLRRGADANAAQADGMTALHWAALRGDVEAARMLAYAGAHLEATTRLGSYTPLHLASEHGRGPVVVALVEAGAGPSVTTSTGATPLMFAARAGDLEAVRGLLDHGARVDARETASGQTALMFAAAANQARIIRPLVEHGADVDLASSVVDVVAREKAFRDEYARRARREAALEKVEEAERAAQAAAEQPTGEASEEANLESEPDEPEPGEEKGKPDEPDAAGQEAARERPDASKSAEQENEEDEEETSEKTEEEGPEPLSYGQLVGAQGGLTALHFAARQGHAEAVQALLELGAGIDRVSESDRTSPLLIAIVNGHFDLAMFLLEEGADPNLPSDAGATPLYATLNMQWHPKSLYPQPRAYTQQETSYLELMEALLERGADPNVRLEKKLWYSGYNFDLSGVDEWGATPFWRAAYATDVEAMRLLVAYGADPDIRTRKPPERRRRRNPATGEEDEDEDKSGLPPVGVGEPSVHPIHAASGVGYGQGFAANSHRHVPDGWLPAVRYLVEELGADIDARDHDGYTPLHHAAARGDVELIRYLVSKGADVTAVSRAGQSTADMANGPVQRVQPFPEARDLLVELGAVDNGNCVSC